MQNHSPYDDDYENFENTVLTGLDIPGLDRYLSLIKLSDRELEGLIEYFSDVPEKTVIVFFGDHQPMLELYPAGCEPDTTEGLLEKYSTPFMIWTNFDTGTEDAGYVSLNYLSLLTKKKAGMPLTRFDGFLEDMYEEYPVFSVNVTLDNGGNEELKNEYEYLQYYYLFDS